MKYIFVSTKVQSRIDALNKSGKSGACLAQKTTRIIEKLVAGDFRNHADAVGNPTKYGEKRIQNCRKYDLGCGYRLITLPRDETIFVAFLGTHDECHRWLESNSGMKDFNCRGGKTLRVSGKKRRMKQIKVAEKIDLDTDDDFIRNLTDKDLRYVFSGLIEGMQ